jgi:hypothetical protein
MSLDTSSDDSKAFDELSIIMNVYADSLTKMKKGKRGGIN